MCKILVGEGEACFLVNEGYSQTTSFFAKHGPPKRHSANPLENQTLPRHRSPTVDSTGSDLFFPEQTTQPPQEAVESSVDLTDTDADFELRGQFFYCRSTFVLFVDYLHGKDLKMPEDEDACECLFKLYALAQYYDVRSLRTAIIQKLQSYYVKNQIPLTHVIFIANNWPNDAETGLSTYLIAQFAYELAISRKEGRSIGEEMAVLFTDANIGLARRILEVVLQYANPGDSVDPAKNKQY